MPWPAPAGGTGASVSPCIPGPLPFMDFGALLASSAHFAAAALMGPAPGAGFAPPSFVPPPSSSTAPVPSPFAPTPAPPLPAAPAGPGKRAREEDKGGGEGGGGVDGPKKKPARPPHPWRVFLRLARAVARCMAELSLGEKLEFAFARKGERRGSAMLFFRTLSSASRVTIELVRGSTLSRGMW